LVSGVGSIISLSASLNQRDAEQIVGPERRLRLCIIIGPAKLE
jgi:hypothetical protein